MKGDKRWIPAEFVADYRGWTPANTLPANPGFHGGRFLLTYCLRLPLRRDLRGQFI